MEYRVHADVCVRQSKTHGLGVFARAPVKADSVIETCAVLENMYRRTPGHPCAFRRYLYYAWEEHPDVGFMPSGLGTMYNDGGRCCNVMYELDMNTRCMTFRALRGIEPDEELTIDYRAMTRPELKCSF